MFYCTGFDQSSKVFQTDFKNGIENGFLNKRKGKHKIKRKSSPSLSWPEDMSLSPRPIP